MDAGLNPSIMATRGVSAATHSQVQNLCIKIGVKK